MTPTARKDMEELIELARRDLGVRGHVRIVGSAEGRLTPMSPEEADRVAQLLSDAAVKSHSGGSGAAPEQLRLSEPV